MRSCGRLRPCGGLLSDCRFAAGRDEGRGVAVAESLRSEELGVARAAMDLAVGAVAGQSRVERTMAFGAVEARLVPDGALGQLLLRLEDGAAAARASLALRRLDRSGVPVVERARLSDLVVTASEEQIHTITNHSGPNERIHLPQAVGLQETRAARESVAMRSPFLAVARLAVDVTVRSIASDDRVERLRAVVTLEALSVPLAALRQHLLGGEHNAATAWAPLTRRRLDLGSIGFVDFRCHIALGEIESELGASTRKYDFVGRRNSFSFNIIHRTGTENGRTRARMEIHGTNNRTIVTRGSERVDGRRDRHLLGTESESNFE